MEAYDDTGYIGLPDGRILRVQGWLESYPPQPAGLKDIAGMMEVESVTHATEVVA